METNFSISVVSGQKPRIAIVTITRDDKTGLPNVKINHTGYLFEDTLVEEIIPQDFFDAGRKKVLFLAENSVVNIDRQTARRSTLITTCDAAVVHMPADQLDRDKCMKRLAIIDKNRCIDLMRALHIQTLLMGDELAGTILIEDTPITNAAATKIGAILHYRYAYVGQDYLDIQECNLPVYFDKNLTVFQNQLGAVLDADTTENLKNMFFTTDNSNIAVMILSYCNIEQSMQYINQLLKYGSIVKKMKETKAGRAFLAAVGRRI